MAASKKKKLKSKTKDTKEVVKEREYTPEEKARIEEFLDRSQRESLKVVKKGKSSKGIPNIEMQKADDPLSLVKFMEAMGTTDTDLQGFLLDQAVNTFQGCNSAEGVNFDNLDRYTNNALAILNGIHPRDEIEGMLAVQMVGVHNLAMSTIRRAMISDQTFDGKQANVNQATKMLRTFVAQMEALKRYRTGGQQKVVVEHVHVNKGGQAIVGTVNQGGGGSDEKKRG